MAKNNLLYSLVNVSGMTLISRILGFLRDVVQTKYFGTSSATDAWIVAFRLPNLLRRIFGEGAFSQAFVPMLADYKNKQSLNDTKDFIAHVSGILLIVLLVLTILGMIFTNLIIVFTAPGFIKDPHKVALTSTLLRITFPYIIFISLASLVGGVLNTWKKFSIPAFTPALLNISFIVFILYFRKFFHPPILALAWALIIGGISQLAFQLPYLKKIGLPLIPRFYFKDPAVWRLVKLMIPAIFAMSISQISIVINTIFASFLQNGSITWMFYADRLMEFPTGVLGVALGTILLPSLSKFASLKNHQQFSQTLDWGLRLCLILALPSTFGLALIAKPLTMTLFMHGKFTMFDTIMTAKALIAYAVGLLGLILVKVFGPGFYANKDIKTPVKIGIFVLICTQVMNLIFIGPLKHVGLSLSISLAACINAFCLCYILLKRKMYTPSPGWGIFLFKLMIAIFCMSIITIASLRYLPFDFSGLTSHRIISLCIIILIAIISYFSTLFVLGFRVKHFAFKDDE
ncbi:MAG: murein biosynthesis integral membrane protein MurJ [Bacteroidia bacterium]|nr:MAG: murein biosynthesis integral membrane protein MurJ [Bacteroidia bacterium]